MPTPAQQSAHRARRSLHPAVIILPSVALILSCVMTWATVGFGPEFMARWVRSFVTTLVVLPFVLASLGFLEKQVDKVIGGLPVVTKKLITAAVTACLIETVIAFAITAVGHPFDASFAGNWWLAFSRSLPAGIAIGLFMCFYMKPKMDEMHAKASLG